MIADLLIRIFAAPPEANTPVVAVPTPGTKVSFDTAFERLIGHEGGYANHPDDPGGETMWGITKRVARESGYTCQRRFKTDPLSGFSVGVNLTHPGIVFL